MSHAYLEGPGQPDREILMPKGQAIAGHALGIVVIDIWYPLLPGNVANATTSDFPVLYHVLKGATIPQIISGDPALLDQIIAGGQVFDQIRRQGRCGRLRVLRLFPEGGLRGHSGADLSVGHAPCSPYPALPHARSEAGNPGRFGNIHHPKGLRPVAASRTAPVWPWSGPRGFRSFRNCWTAPGNSTAPGWSARSWNGHPEIGALLIQYSDLPPFAHTIQKAVHLPVFDMTTLINWVYQAVVRNPYQDFI